MVANNQSDRHLSHQLKNMPPKGLVLTHNVVIGRQIEHMLSSTWGWDIHVVHNDRSAYSYISQVRLHAIIADIDDSALGGLPVLVYTKRHYPWVTTYAITSNEDLYVKHLACGMGGCKDFFYLTKGKKMVNPDLGLAAELTSATP